MTTPFWCLLVVAVIPFVLAGVGAWFRSRQLGSADNSHPRVQTLELRGQFPSRENWRAREILAGSIQHFLRDPTILEKYGLLLDRLGDRVEAGKLPFLSGRRGETYDPASRLFLDRHAKRHLNNVASQFPRSVTEGVLADHPDAVLAA